MTLDLSSTAKRLLDNLAISSASGDLKIIKVDRLVDPLTGEASIVGETVAAIAGAVTDYTDSQVDGVTVLVGDRKVMADNTVAVSIGDQVEFQGKRWRAVGVKTKLSGTITQVTEIQIRGLAGGA